MAHVFQTYQKNGKPHPRWRFEYRDRFGKKRKGTGSTSKRDTLRMALDVEAREAAIRHGYREAPPVEKKPQPFKPIAQEYLRWGDSQGGRGGRPWGARHSMNRHRHMDWWETALKLQFLEDLNGTLPKVEHLLRGLIDDGRTNRTVASYAETIRAFCRWCVERDYLELDPLRKLRSFDITPITTRRAMTVDEIQALLSAAPIERRMLYEVALNTGLRANELRSLTVQHLDVEQNGLWLDAAWTKNRKPGFQPLPSDLVIRLARFAASGVVQAKFDRFYCRRDTQQAPNDRLLYILSNPIKAFDEDLDAAGIPKVTNEGKLDFHALRVTYATLIFENGATVKEAQHLLRHSDPRITMNTYAKIRPHRLRDVTEALAVALAKTPAAQAPLSDSSEDPAQPLAS